MKTHTISAQFLSIDKVEKIINSKAKLALSEESRQAVQKCRDFLDQKMENSTVPVYGVTTGFGSLCNTSVSKEDLSTLQSNLVKSHACGIGDEVPQEIVRLMLLMKVQSLSYGNSGVQVQTIERLIDFYNKGVYPVVYQQGSLGASGDLAPLAHMCLPLLNEGEVYYRNKKYPASEINEKFGWKPIKLQSKEGLALLNGTQFMSSYAVYLLMKSRKLSWLADIIGAISLEAFDGRIEPFNLSVHFVRPHVGQILTATHINNLLMGSEIIYSVTDNPTVFPDEDLIISAGNFHGQPLALVLDFLSLAMSELGNISERRIYQLISGKRELPSFLVKNPGLNSGFMIPQYTAASIVNQNKTFTMPSSSDSIESSQGQEDHVSMGANAATKAYKVVENVEKILAIELLNAAQALEFRRPLKSSEFIEDFIEQYRRFVPFVENDTIMYKLMAASREFIQNVDVVMEEM